MADLASLNVISGKVHRLVKGVSLGHYWISPNARYVAYLTLEGHASDNEALWDLGLYAIEDHTSRFLVRAIKSNAAGVFASWSPDSKSIAYLADGSGGMANGGPQGNCFVMGINGSQPRNVTSGSHPAFGGLFAVPLWDPKGGFNLSFTSDGK